MKKFLVLFLFAFHFSCSMADPEMMELLREIKAQNETLLEDVKKMKAQLDGLDVKYQVILASLADNKKELEALKAQVDSLKAQLTQQLDKINQLSTQLEVQGADVKKLSAEIAALKANCEELKGLIEELLSDKSPIPTNGLIAWYPFNGNANDESGNGNNGTVNGARLTFDRFGNENRAYSFENNNYIESEIAQSKAFTISAWAYFDDKNSFYSIVQHKPKCTRGAGPYLGINNDGRYRYVHSSCGECSILACSNEIDFKGEVVPIRSWDNYSVTSDGVSTFNFYFNGELVGSAIEPIVAINQYGIQPFTMGLHADGQNIFYLNGDLDDIGLWNRALDDEEILEIYNGLKF